MFENGKIPANFPEPILIEAEPLTQTMERAENYLVDAMRMTIDIETHLFGNNETSGDKIETKCYRDRMIYHAKKLEELCVKLELIAKHVGV